MQQENDAEMQQTEQESETMDAAAANEDPKAETVADAEAEEKPEIIEQNPEADDAKQEQADSEAPEKVAGIDFKIDCSSTVSVAKRSPDLQAMARICKRLLELALSCKRSTLSSIVQSLHCDSTVAVDLLVFSLFCRPISVLD